MAREVMDAVEKLMQFNSNTEPDKAVTRSDLAPLLNAVAAALIDIDRRLPPARAPKGLYGNKA